MTGESESSTNSTSNFAGESISNRDQEINIAAAILSLSGPCRSVGDIYLACVATAGLGQCRHLRASFENCAKATAAESKEYLGIVGEMNCPPEEKDKELCAALLVNQQLMIQLAAPSASANQD